MLARRSLPLHLTLNFFALVILIAFITGLPAIWLIRQQLYDQAWEQVEQGVQTTRALFEAQQNELSHLAEVVSNRPTRQRLISSAEVASLLEYLEDLRLDADLDMIALCPSGQRAPIASGDDPHFDFCEASLPPGYLIGWDGHI